MGWHTAAIVPELAREIRLQNDPKYRCAVIWLQSLTSLIENYQNSVTRDREVANLITAWLNERRIIRLIFALVFNQQC